MARRVKRRRSNPGPRKPLGIVGKVNNVLRGWKLLGAPAAGGISEGGFSMDGLQGALKRISGFDMENRNFDMEAAKRTATHYGTAIAVDKGLSMLRIPQMAGRKKILALVANFYPEIEAIPKVIEGNMRGALNREMAFDHGYWPIQHQDWLNDGGQIRAQFLQGLGVRVGLGLTSKFLGPVVNKHLPKGVNI